MSDGITPAIQDQAEQLADGFLQLSMTLDQIRATDSSLSDADAQTLGTIARQLDELSDQLNAAAIVGILQSIQPNINNIIQTTKDAQNAIKTIGKIQKIVSIGGAALTLAAAIVSGNPATVLSAAAGVVKAIGGSGAPATGGAGAVTNPSTGGAGPGGGQ